MNKNIIAVETLSAFADNVVAAYGHKTKAESTGASIATTIAEFYAATCNDAETFCFYFGNGLLGKKNDVGEIRRVLDAKTAKMLKAKRDGVSHMLRQRLSEARKLYEVQGMPAKGETIQAALKRYTTKKDTAPQQQNGDKVSAVSIADNASLDDIADALSIWVAKHGAASAGLVAKLADFLPVSVKRTTRKVA